MSLTWPNVKAQYWGVTSIHTAVVPLGWTEQDFCEVSVSSEVPMAGGVRVSLRGNRCYGSEVALSLSERDVKMPPHQARQMALALLRAAEVAEAHDVADCAPCGHWAPCTCQETR